MLEPKILPNGNLLILVRVEENGVVGDSLMEISPTHPDWEKWQQYIKKTAQ